MQQNIISPTDSEYLLSFWKLHLLGHFQAEEDFIIPEIPSEKRNDPSIRRVLNDHARFKELAASLEASSEESVEKLTEFAALLKAHVDHEEHEFLPFAEAHIPADRFPEVARKLEGYYVQADKGWDPEFWK